VKLLILERDGVINEEFDEPVTSPADWQPIPGSPEAIARANSAGYHVVIASNQPGLALGRFDIDVLNDIHQKMFSELSVAGGHVDAVFFCPHAPKDKCECRKPGPGMLLEIGMRFHADLRAVPVIGNSLPDIQAARAAGAQPVLVRTGHWQQTMQHKQELVGVSVYENLAAAVDALLSMN
jgi:D-glycero-D-manno-heptose 1,7-bisphosphate phosphatase